MEDTDYGQIPIQYCFPDNNASCRKEVRTGPANVFVIIFLSCVSVCTVCLSLLVIISISHFKQLHTPTNLLILSLAVADLLVGLVAMPVKTMAFVDTCWYFGQIACTISDIINGVSLSASLCSLVFIAVDRYIAICDPLRYSTRVTVCKMSVSITLGWSFCVFYVITYYYFNDHVLPSQISTRCYGECVVFMKPYWLIVDLVFFFLAPCFLILILYLLIFNVARRHAKAVRSMMHDASNRCSSSEFKAAKTLGVVIAVYLACWIPYYICSLAGPNMTTASMAWSAFGWLIYMNSTVNPLIYAVFYPWFRKSAAYIVSCRILDSSSSNVNLLPDSLD